MFKFEIKCLNYPSNFDYDFKFTQVKALSKFKGKTEFFFQWQDNIRSKV